MKKVLKKLFAPAIVLLLVVVMGVFSPVVSVAAALRLSIASDPGVVSSAAYNIENLPARTVELGSVVTTLPSVTNSGLTKLWHAGREVTLPAGNYTYPEVGQYEWRFYTAVPESVLFDTYTVTVTDTTYKMALPNNVVTVAPKGMSELKLPLPASYTIGGNTMEVDGDITFNSANHYAIVKLKKDKKDITSTNYRLSATVSLENNTFADDKISFDSKNLKINLSSYQNSTGNLKVTYFLRKDDSSNKLLAATPLNDIEIKNVQKGDVTFANIPTAPSVSNLSYYSNVTLTAPTADSAKVDKSTSFTVEAQTSIVKVQAYLYQTKPNWSKDSNVRNFTVDENGVVKEGNNVVNDIIEIDGLNVKVKALGYYRFQFQTSTLFGYKMDSDFDNYDAIEQDSNKTYVRYWSDNASVMRDSVKPNFAWMKEDYDTANATRINEISENFSEYLNDCEKYLPMTEKPDASTEKKVTVNFNSGLTVPAIFPHDNATAFDDMIDTVTVTISQDNDDEGRTSNDGVTLNSSVYSGTSNTSTTFEYNPRKHMNIKFETNGVNGGSQSENEITLKTIAGLYHVTITVTEKQPVFKGNNEKYSGGYAQSESKTLYFYVDGDYDNTTAANSPKIDENDAFKVSDVYLWEGRTFDFSAPSFSDVHTSTNNLQIDYYLVCKNSGNYVAVAKLDYTTNASRINVDLNKLEYVQDNTLNITDYPSLAAHFNDTFYIYAVARNFNGMQADLKNSYTPANGLVETHFSTDLFNVISLKDNAKVAKNGYAWKRAGFKIHAVDNAKVATVATAEVSTVGNNFVAKKNIKITGVSASWGSDVVDGQLSVAVYRVKDNALIPVDVRNGSATNAPIVSSIAFNRKSQAFDSDLYFTPSVSGEYILVVTAKNNASDKIFSKVTKITIGHSDDYDVRPTDTNNSDTIDETIDLGESLTLPSYDITLNKEVVYKAKNRLVFKASDGSEIGYYTVTVLGTNDTNCVTGNKFVPNNYGKYKFQYKFYDAKNTPDDANDDVLLKTEDYVVRVNEAEGSSNILMGEDYDADADRILWAVTETDNGEKTYIVDGQTYHAGINDTNTKTKPAYAITLPQFVMSNYGAANDFVVDSADLFKYLEPEYNAANDEIKGYMYPAIAIPMPNVVADETSSDEVEITVQKSGKTKYLVSTKKMNAGNSTNKASEIDKIQDFYVFRPEGVFSADCRTAYNKNNYLQTADSKSGASGVYTVTYKTSTSSVSYNITIGNLKNGQVDWKENFLTYDNGDGAKAITDASDKLIIEKDKDGHRYVTIDMSKVFFTGNDDMLSLIAQGPNGDQTMTGYASNDHAKEYYWKNVSVTVSYDNGSFIDYDDWSEASSETKMIKDHENFKYKFDLTQGSGTYKVTIRMTNSYTASPVTKSIEFTLDAEATKKNVNLNTVWGIILIVLSVGLLGGVIFYFVRTARVTRFVDAPRAMKSREKNKTTKPVAAPKDVEAPKDDVK